MGNNKEIRQRMETYRSFLLVLNWICCIALIITGFALSGIIKGYSAIIIIVAIVLGIIGHFLINVGLAIPFILLNNGDILESKMQNNKSSQSQNSTSSIGYKYDNEPQSVLGYNQSGYKKSFKTGDKCNRCGKIIGDGYTACPHCGNN